jgi:ubiquinone/menaquinone biosynthesis C-methylase UbiE
MENPRKVKDFFETMAKRFGVQAILIPGGSQFRNLVLQKIMKKTLAPILESLTNKSILEIGCGIGRWCKIISKKNSVTGIDISRFMIFEAKKSKDNKCSFLVADLSFLPFKDGAFDLVVSITVLQHILNQKKFMLALAEIKRCSKADVIIVEEMWSKKITKIGSVFYPIRILPAKFYVKELSSRGFHVDCINGLTITPLAILFAKSYVFLSKYMMIYLNEKQKGLAVRSRLINFLMGVSTLSALFAPGTNYNPNLSLHTLIHAKKRSSNID